MFLCCCCARRRAKSRAEQSRAEQSRAEQRRRRRRRRREIEIGGQILILDHTEKSSQQRQWVVLCARGGWGGTGGWGRREREVGQGLVIVSHSTAHPTVFVAGLPLRPIVQKRGKRKRGSVEDVSNKGGGVNGMPGRCTPCLLERNADGLSHGVWHEATNGCRLLSLHDQKGAMNCVMGRTAQ